MLESNSPESGVRDDEMQLVAELHFVLEKSDPPTGDASVQQCNDDPLAVPQPREASCVNTWISKGGTVAEFKAVLESQDLLLPTPDSDMAEFLVEARLGPSSSPLDDNFVIPEGTNVMHVTVRPRSQANSSQKQPVNLFSPSPSSGTDGVSQVVSTGLTEPPRVRPIFPTEIPTAIPRCDASSDNEWHNALRDMLLVGPAPESPPRVEPAVASVQRPRVMPTAPQGQFLFGPNITDDFSNNSGFPNQALIQQFANSAIKNILSNPTTLQTLMESNPEMRDLRERNPELNHLLNDTELLKQSMEVMRNPSLMREMINNTDRALNNIDAIPGGFNALRRVYQSIQEPIWDAAMVGGRSSGSDCEPPRVYDLRTDQAPNTEAVPNPWAPRVAPSSAEISPLAAPSPFTTNMPPLMQQVARQQQSAASILSDPAVLSLYSSALPSIIRMTTDASSSMSAATTAASGGGPSVIGRSLGNDVGAALRAMAALSSVGAGNAGRSSAAGNHESASVAAVPGTVTTPGPPRDGVATQQQQYPSHSDDAPALTMDDCSAHQCPSKQSATDIPCESPQVGGWRMVADTCSSQNNSCSSEKTDLKESAVGSSMVASVPGPSTMTSRQTVGDEPTDREQRSSQLSNQNPAGFRAMSTSAESTGNPTGASTQGSDDCTTERFRTSDAAVSTWPSLCTSNVPSEHSASGDCKTNGTGPTTPRRTDSETSAPLRSSLLMSRGVLPFPSYFRFFSGTGGCAGSGYLPGAPHISGASRPSSSSGSLGTSSSIPPPRVTQDTNHRSCTNRMSPPQAGATNSNNVASQPSERRSQSAQRQVAKKPSEESPQ